MVVEDFEDVGEHGVPRRALGAFGHLPARRRCRLVVEGCVVVDVSGLCYSQHPMEGL